jgi:hypothetical protein
MVGHLSCTGTLEEGDAENHPPYYNYLTVCIDVSERQGTLLARNVLAVAKLFEFCAVPFNPLQPSRDPLVTKSTPKIIWLQRSSNFNVRRCVFYFIPSNL